MILRPREGAPSPQWSGSTPTPAVHTSTPRVLRLVSPPPGCSLRPFAAQPAGVARVGSEQRVAGCSGTRPLTTCASSARPGRRRLERTSLPQSRQSLQLRQAPELSSLLRGLRVDIPAALAVGTPDRLRPAGGRRSNTEPSPEGHRQRRAVATPNVESTAHSIIFGTSGAGTSVRGASGLFGGGEVRPPSALCVERELDGAIRSAGKGARWDYDRDPSREPLERFFPHKGKGSCADVLIPGSTLGFGTSPQPGAPITEGGRLHTHETPRAAATPLCASAPAGAAAVASARRAANYAHTPLGWDEVAQRKLLSHQQRLAAHGLLLENPLEKPSRRAAKPLRSAEGYGMPSEGSRRTETEVERFCFGVGEPSHRGLRLAGGAAKAMHELARKGESVGAVVFGGGSAAAADTEAAAATEPTAVTEPTAATETEPICESAASIGAMRQGGAPLCESAVFRGAAGVWTAARTRKEGKGLVRSSWSEARSMPALLYSSAHAEAPAEQRFSEKLYSTRLKVDALRHKVERYHCRTEMRPSGGQTPPSRLVPRKLAASRRSAARPQWRS